MKISELLCSPRPGPNANDPPLPQCSPPITAAVGPQRCCKATAKKPPKHPAVRCSAVVPDSQRKRPYRMSVTQQLNRRALQNYESKVFNLTLDTNALRQQVQHLLECRDLYLTRLFLTRQQLEGDALGVAENLVNGFSKKGPSLTASQRSRVFSHAEGGGVHQLVLERGTHIFSHRRWTTTYAQVLSFVEEEDDGVAPDAAETRRLCADSNGCVVETVGIFTGRIKREMIAAFYPHALSDEALVSRLIGYRITCPVRLVFYFDDQRRITHQLAQVDVVASMKPLEQERPQDFAVLMGD
ncbi:WD repeat-containing protein 60 [Phytophthora pseudosyringae]|uniref:WD repeat-containing protein 60 n=1 Tax=Phytophthora pseudosyringae TaxID=221518 RepID=A0A8T1VD62_9STRA|nr:WD repeat-containing protein 60 [Phytophthora pseudosyringae]